MDRAVKLAAEARKHLKMEAQEIASTVRESRKDTRDELARVARELGYSKRREISAAINAALTAAGATP